jgi:hypothetical protein
MNIIHIFGLPRSGTTLLQKLVATSNSTVTLPETWFLLSLNMFESSSHGYNEIGYSACKRGCSDFNKNNTTLFAKKYSLYKEILTEQFNENDFFIEKTPRNIIIGDEIIKNLDKDDKVLFLKRDLQSNFESYLEYFDSFPYMKSYKFYKEIIAYNKKMESLIFQYPKGLVVSFDDLKSNPQNESENISQYLGVNDVDYLNLNTNVVKKGAFGDQKMRNSKSIKKDKSKRSKAINLISKFYFERKFSFLGFFNYGLSKIIFRFNLNLLVYIFKKNRFIH